MHLSSGGGEKIHPAFASLNYVPKFKEMVAAGPHLFPSSSPIHREAAGSVVAALLAAKTNSGANQNPRVLGAEGEGGETPGPPQRDKAREQKFNLGVSLQEREQLQVLAMLEENREASRSV